jgi:copper chaperone CopZ
VPGVDQVEVSLEQGEAQVRFDPASADPARLTQAVENAGYQARV